MGETIHGVPLFAEPQVRVTQRDDGVILVDSPFALGEYRRSIGAYLEHWADAAPDRPFLLERDAGRQWRGVTYGQARRKVIEIASWLLKQDAGTSRPVVVLSDNSVEHGLLMLACMHIGVPYAAISSAYSLVSRDHAKLKGLIKRLEPGLLYVADPGRYAPALAAIEGLHRARLVTAAGHAVPAGGISFSALLGEVDEAAVAEAFAGVGPDTVAKILFTSGSTSEPKGVINTQRMLCSSQQGKLQLWPFLQDTPPVLLDWLPWNHTFGGNHNFNMVLCNGGTLYIDSGKPMPGAFDLSIANLREVSPTLYLNVPRGYDMLVPMLRSDAELRRAFFARLQVIFYAAAALPRYLWDALMELSIQELGHAVPMVTSWGSTETSPLATDCSYQAELPGVIGLPIPGVTLKLLPNGEKLEVRVKGPNVTPGYYKQPEVTAKAFDEEGFYLIGDAVRFYDPGQPQLGLLFDGRVAEDFKLATGTWVSVGALRVKAVEQLAPLAQDIVVAGHDRDYASFLVFPNLAACRQAAGLDDAAPVRQVLAHAAVKSRIRAGLEALRAMGSGSSTYGERALLMADVPSVDAGEITDKGYINQAAVLKNRAVLIQRLYAAEPDSEVIRL
jgi:feruloyl-CoA synthase